MGRSKISLNKRKLKKFEGILSYDERVEKGHHHEKKDKFGLYLVLSYLHHQQGDWLGLKTVVMDVVPGATNRSPMRVQFYLMSLDSDALILGPGYPSPLGC